MKIVVLAKPVPDATGQERLGPDLRLDRAAISPVINGNDEYVLEAALKLADATGDVTITLLTMAGAVGPDAIRKGFAMGAHDGVLVSDPELAGSCTLGTIRVLAAALRRLEFDLVLAGADTADGATGVVGAGVAAMLGLPYLSYASAIVPEGSRVRVRRITPTGYDVLEAPMPALIMGTQALGEPRYPTLRGIIAARSKPIVTWTLADLGLDAASVGGDAATSRVLSSRAPESRGETRFIREPAAVAAAQVVDFLVERGAI